MSPGSARTVDGRYVIVDGRRWRATDPRIPERLRTELVAELMSARRAVGAARREHSVVAEQAARRRVDDAKHALGERGRAWWKPRDDDALAARVLAIIRALLRHRSADSSVCPSEVARIADVESSRDTLTMVRRVAEQLAGRGEIEITRSGNVVESFDGGPVRLRRGRRFPDPVDT